MALTSPLHTLFVRSIRSGQLPSQWKLHFVTPVFKSGNKSDVSNYRPISLLCIASKILEKLIFNRIMFFIYPLISSDQYGFLKGRSSVHKLLSSISLIVDSLDNNQSLDAIFLDIRKAFDSVSHQGLISKLQSFGFVGESLAWFKGYLNSRLHCVRLDGQVSGALPVRSGVPQGSILGPVLFLLYVNDLFSQASYSRLIMFADDSQCLMRIRTPQDSLSLQSDLNSMELWCADWSMSFNAKKCALLRFGPETSPPVYTILNDPIPLCTSQKDLGVLITNNLSWSPHITTVLAKAYRSLNLIKRTLPPNCCNISLKRVLYLTLVRCHLVYCSPIWRPHLVQDSKRLESLQRRATRYLVSRDLDYRSRLITLSLLPISLWLEVQDVLLLVRLMTDPPSNFHLEDHITYVSSSTRASAHNRIKRTHPLIPRLNTTRNFFFNRIVRIWNSLPPINTQRPFPAIKKHIISIFWKYFTSYFSVDNTCTWFIACPCSNCLCLPTPTLSLSIHSSSSQA